MTFIVFGFVVDLVWWWRD